MEKKFNIVVGEDETVKLPDAVLEKLEVKPGEEVRFEVDDNFYAVRLLSRIEAERLDYLNWMHVPVKQDRLLSEWLVIEDDRATLHPASVS